MLHFWRKSIKKCRRHAPQAGSSQGRAGGLVTVSRSGPTDTRAACSRPSHAALNHAGTAPTKGRFDGTEGDGLAKRAHAPTPLGPDQVNVLVFLSISICDGYRMLEFLHQLASRYGGC
jgi:hypothetical protein